MKRVIILMPNFEKRLRERGGDELLLLIEAEILNNPVGGDVVPGSGGVRKIRVADRRRRKGKRGGFRVLFLDLPTSGRTLLLHLYGKDEADDLTSDEKKQIADLVKTIKKNLE